MHRVTRWSRALLFLVGALGAAWVEGCAFDPAEDGDERVGAAEQRQSDTGTNVWRKYTFRESSITGTEIAQMIGLNRNTGGFVAGNEYWYVDEAALGSLGTSNIHVSYIDGSGVPSAPSYSTMQTFTQPVNPTGGWGTGWTSDPLSGLGKLYQNSSHALRLQTTGTGSSTTITSVAWYQVIPSTRAPANITPSGTFGYASGGTVTVTTGNLGYDIDQAP